MYKETMGYTNHTIHITNQVQQGIQDFFQYLQICLDKRAMIHVVHQDAVRKDLIQTLQILEEAGQKIGKNPKEVMKAVEDFVNDKPIARWFTAATFNMHEMMSYAPDFLRNQTKESLIQMLQQRIQKGNIRIEAIKKWFASIHNITIDQLVQWDNMQYINTIYNQCCSNIEEILNTAQTRYDSKQENMTQHLRTDIKRGREMYKDTEECEETIQHLTQEYQIADNERVDIIYGLILINYFNKPHKITKLYNGVLLETVRNFIENRSWYNDYFERDFKYLTQEYASLITLYDSDYAIYEHSLVIKEEIEKMLEQKQIHVRRYTPNTYQQKGTNNFLDELPF